MISRFLQRELGNKIYAFRRGKENVLSPQGKKKKSGMKRLVYQEEEITRGQ